MQLTKDQITTYERDGFLVLPEVFSVEEVEAMKADLKRIQEIDTDHLVRERGNNLAKTIYRVHEDDGPTASPIFYRATRAPRLLRAAQQLLADEALYVFHTKCNLKTAIDGSVWQWHQDYGSWRHDGVPQPTLTTALIMLDEPTEMNGCLYFLPGSHKRGNLGSEMDDKTTSYRLWIVPKEQLIDIMEQSPEPVAILGKPGTVVFFHCNILHSSGHNLSRFERWHIYVVYNQVANKPNAVPNPRPDYQRSVNFKPLIVGSDEILTMTKAVSA